MSNEKFSHNITNKLLCQFYNLLQINSYLNVIFLS